MGIKKEVQARDRDLKDGDKGDGGGKHLHCTDFVLFSAFIKLLIPVLLSELLSLCIYNGPFVRLFSVCLTL